MSTKIFVHRKYEKSKLTSVPKINSDFEKQMELLRHDEAEQQAILIADRKIPKAC
jgi:hypothetical protein